MTLTRKDITERLKEALKNSYLGRHLVYQAKTKNYIVRAGFFYRGGKTAKNLEADLIGALNTAGIKHTIVQIGEVWKPFRGGSTVANSSHWFVKFTINE